MNPSIGAFIIIPRITPKAITAMLPGITMVLSIWPGCLTQDRETPDVLRFLGKRTDDLAGKDTPDEPDGADEMQEAQKWE